MTQHLELFPLFPSSGAAPGGGSDPPSPEALALPERQAAALVRTDDGGLELAGLDAIAPGATVLGVVQPIADRPLERALVPWGNELLIDGEPALGVALLRPGRTVSAEAIDLLVVRVHIPEIEPVPADLAGTPCPVCSTPLEGTIVRCVCGCAFHHAVESEGEPLRCWASVSACPRCGERPTLATSVQPDPARLGWQVTS